MGYKEIFDAFNKSSCKDSEIPCSGCSVELTGADISEYLECDEIDQTVVNTFIETYIKSKCIQDHGKITILNLVFGRITLLKSSFMVAIFQNEIALECFLKKIPTPINNESLRLLLIDASPRQDIVQFCLDNSLMNTSSLKIFIGYSVWKEIYRFKGSTVRNQEVVDRVTKIVLSNPSLVDDSLMDLICYHLDVYWTLFNEIVGKGYVLNDHHYSLIIVYCEIETIDKVIQKTRVVLKKIHFRELVRPLDFGGNLVAPSYTGENYVECHGNNMINKIKLLQKYGYAVTREDWILALECGFVLEGVNFMADEDVIKICTENNFFPEFQWPSKELRKKYEFRSLLKEPKTANIRKWIKANNYVPDEDAMCYYGSLGKNIKVLNFLIECGGKVTDKVLKETKNGYGSQRFKYLVGGKYTKN